MQRYKIQQYRQSVMQILSQLVVESTSPPSQSSLTCGEGEDLTGAGWGPVTGSYARKLRLSQNVGNFFFWTKVNYNKLLKGAISSITFHIQ